MVETPDGGGGVAIVWGELTTERCFIERVQSFRFDVERVQSGAVGSFPTVRLEVDYHSKTAQIDNTMRAVDLDNDTVFTVNFVQDLQGRRRKLAITCTEGSTV